MGKTWFALLVAAWLWPMAARGADVVFRPKETDDTLLNPGRGIQTFQRFDGEAIYPTLEWSEAGPERKGETPAARADFPDSSVAYLRWFWSQVEPQPGVFRWEIIDAALSEARRHRQTLDIRVMPYDDRHPLPAWYRESGARRINKPEDKDGAVWSPDAEDPRYSREWRALVRAMGARYDGHADLNSVDISTVGYWGEGWGPYLPDWRTQKSLIDAYFGAFRRTPLLVNFGSLRAIEYAVKRGAGWRLDCWGDLGGMVEEGFAHMLDRYPQWVLQAGAQDAWKHHPVSLETCGTPGHWKLRGYGERELREILDQALRWHASTVNIKSTAIPTEYREAFRVFEKRLGYRFVLRRLELPERVQAGGRAVVRMLWLNAGVAPVYRDYALAVKLLSPTQSAVIRTDAAVRSWLPGDTAFNSTVTMPDTLESGEYDVLVSLVDPASGVPAIRLAIEGREADGWYRVGAVHVDQAHPGPQG